VNPPVLAFILPQLTWKTTDHPITSVEMLYLESKWASLIPFAKVADLMKEVLPVNGSVNPETIRNHLQATAERIEQALGHERQLTEYEGTEEEWEEQPTPDGPITVGIDGGYVRAAHKQGCFEVIAGKSMVAFRREDATPAPPGKCFGFVQIYDDKPRRRLWELLKSQGMQENQQVVFMSDGGEDVRRVQQYLHPSSEHLLDWFHITMRLTVLQQQTKSLQQERSAMGADVAKRLESIKHFLWHARFYQVPLRAKPPRTRLTQTPGSPGQNAVPCFFLSMRTEPIVPVNAARLSDRIAGGYFAASGVDG